MKTNQHFINGLSILETVIGDLTRSFRKLESSKNFKHKHYKLEKNKELISNLYDVYDSFYFLKMYSSWIELEQKMKQMEDKDDQLSGFIIVIRTRLQGNQLGLIDKYTDYEDL